MQMLRDKHRHCDTAGKRGARTTVGVILDKCTVAFVVPGSPATRPLEGAGLCKGDIITRIDGQPVDSKDIVTRLRGKDEPGAVVRVTLARSGGSSVDEVTMMRESLGKVTRTKDLYLSLAAARSAADRRDFSVSEQLPSLLEKIETSVSAVEEGRDEGERALRGHIADLEATLDEQMTAANALVRKREERLFRERDVRKSVEMELAAVTSRNGVNGSNNRSNTSSCGEMSRDATMVSERERELSASLEIALNELEKRW